MQIFVKSFGCSANMADGAVLAGVLSQAGHQLVNTISAADVVVYNTCAVKGPTENRIIEVLKRVPANKRLIVCGCLPAINYERLLKEVRFDGVMGPTANERIVEMVNNVSKGDTTVTLDNNGRGAPELALPRIQTNPVISIIPVSYGCLGSCTYCCVVFARGCLRSCTNQEVVRRLERDIAKGIREFWITSQDTGCYGRDKGSSLVELLRKLCTHGGDFKIRVGMMTPNTVLDMLDGLIEVFHDRHIFKFIHLPVQSGDDQILRRMHRLYSANDFKRIVMKFRSLLPKITLATDVICGFPGESEEAFEKTLKLMEDIEPDIVNVSKFFVRPKTDTVKMQKDFLPFSEIKRRSSIASSLAKRLALEKNQSWIGWSGEIIVDEAGKIVNSWIGRNFAYKPVIVRSATQLLGKKLRVEITNAFPTYLEGKILE